MPALGITRVANVTYLDRIGIPVVMVCRPNARGLAVYQGKGVDLVAAKASGLMEAVETYHAEHITLPLKLGSYEELGQTHCVVDVTRFPHPSPNLYHPNRQLLWIEGFDLIQRERVWIPYETVHTNYTLPLPAGSGCFISSSTGLAAGNHLLEAVSQGICEVVERDAHTLWRTLPADEQARRRIDLTTVDDPACRDLLDQYAQADIAVAVWEMTSDIEIPTFLCTIAEREDDPLHPMLPFGGMGCHPTRHVALLRALTEAAQSRLTFIVGARDDIVGSEYESLDHRDVAGYGRRLLEAGGPMRSFREGPTFDGDTFNADIAWELSRVQAAGIERLVVVDLTRPALQLPVVKVVIPGLEDFTAEGAYLYGPRGRSRLGSGP
jgi:ribosomal protein S12 methylthiotransferase accessory factor